METNTPRVRLPSLYEWSMHPLQSSHVFSRWAAIKILTCGPTPRHVAFIMDGNRRYARKNNVEKQVGHAAGFEKLKETLEWCMDLGVKVVTVYAFSIENFKRSKEEVDALMDLAVQKFQLLLDQSEVIHRNQVKVNVLGDFSLLPSRLRQVLAQVMKISQHYDRAVLNVCLSYTSREEMTRAANDLALGVKNGELVASDICPKLFERALYTQDFGKVDLLIRSSGEIRLSDFLLWQAGDACIQFRPVLWPEFRFRDLLSCILAYQSAASTIEQLRIQERVEYEEELYKNAQMSVLKRYGNQDDTSADIPALVKSEMQSSMQRQDLFVQKLYQKRLDTLCAEAKDDA